MTDHRTVHIYALEHDGRAYIGSALDPTVRLRAHIEGTGAKCTRRWMRELVPALPDFKLLGEYPEDDRVPAEEAWIVEYVRRGWDMVNRAFRVWPIDSEASARGGRTQIRKLNEIQKADGWKHQLRTVRKMNEINKVNGYEAQRRGARNRPIEVNRRNARRINEAMLANGTHPFLDPETRRRGQHAAYKVNTTNEWERQRWNMRRMNEKHKANGHEAQHRGGHNQSVEAKSLGGRRGAPRANHTRWHVNRGITNPDCALCLESL